MGKRVRGAVLRSKKRGVVAEREDVETKAVQVETGAVTEKPDDELFVLDTTAIVPSKKQLQKKEKKHNTRSVSAKEQTQIQKLVDTHSEQKLKALIRKTSITAKRAPKVIKASQTLPKYDMWEDDNDNDNKRIAVSRTTVSSGPHGIVPSKHVQIVPTRALPAQLSRSKRKDKQRVTVDVAKSGQSYNPDQKEHRSAIVEALMVETKRKRAENEANKSASQGMSAETKALLLGDSDTEDEEEDDNENDGDGDNDTKTITKRPEKMTKAQRNKQKRVRAEQYEIQERKRQKQMRHELRGVKSVNKKLKLEEIEQKAQREELEQLKAESERSKGKNIYQQLADENPRYAPSFPVALPGELKSGASLRTIKPKGSLVTDRMVSMMDRDMTTKKQLKLKNRVQGKRRKIKVRGKGGAARRTKEGEILG